MKKIFVAILAALLLVPTSAFAQERELTPEEQKKEKEMYEYLQKEIERLERVLNLESWQVFYADSILTHNNAEMTKELRALSQKKVSNYDIYYDVQYKWLDENYYAFQKILTPEQGQKYLKDGAGKAKKSRDKEREKKRAKEEKAKAKKN